VLDETNYSNTLCNTASEKCILAGGLKKHKSEEEVVEHAAAIKQTFNLGPRKYITGSTPIKNHAVNEQSLTTDNSSFNPCLETE
jgi:hypothetical protein